MIFHDIRRRFMDLKKLAWTICFLSILLPASSFAQEKTAQIEGTWEIAISFVCGTAVHTAVIARKDANLTGTYRGEIKEGRLQGTVKGNAVNFTGRLKNEALTVSFDFTGVVDGETMKGTVDMGEFWTATWTAKKKK
jgi:hypothetical protein